MAKFTKSKSDLTTQIGRIYAAHKNHRLYNKAHDLVMLYRHNMSMSQQNKDLQDEYDACLNSMGLLSPEAVEKAQQVCILMYTYQYPMSLYTRRPDADESDF